MAEAESESVNVVQMGKASIDFVARIDISDLAISCSDRYLRLDMYALGLLEQRFAEAKRLAGELGRKPLRDGDRGPDWGGNAG